MTHATHKLRDCSFHGLPEFVCDHCYIRVDDPKIEQQCPKWPEREERRVKDERAEYDGLLKQHQRLQELHMKYGTERLYIEPCIFAGDLNDE